MSKQLKYILLCILLVIVSSVLTFVIYFVINKTKTITPTDIFNNNISSIVEVKACSETIGESYGTGIIYDKEGYLLTNYHVISYTRLEESTLFDELFIRFADSDEYESVDLIKYDEEIDIALLKITNPTKEYLSITFSNDEYTFGDKVYAIGNTSNYGIGISEGIISVPEVIVSYDDAYGNRDRLVIQSDINISSGNSGGALLNSKGELIGITTFRTKDPSSNINYGFVYSIPIKQIKSFIEEE